MCVPDCTQRGSYLLILRSNTCTFPSAVTAANTVEAKGDQATSPTTLLRSYVNIGSLVGEGRGRMRGGEDEGRIGVREGEGRDNEKSYEIFKPQDSQCNTNMVSVVLPCQLSF